uniref:Uncharacterized protein n=1 Tax=Picea glauca TaxID=3330 RepID=A0A117NG85_PICGL|nr:hypothetical protein ABT39_MTgene1499 [Picea glauca]
MGRRGRFASHLIPVSYLFPCMYTGLLINKNDGKFYLPVSLDWSFFHQLSVTTTPIYL